MCLAVPGKVVSREGDEAVVDFQGASVKVSLAMTPEAGPGDWVLVHAGFAIHQLDEEEARETWSCLDEAGVLEEMGLEAPPQESAGSGL